MTKVSFYNPDKIADEKLKYAVIVAEYENKWVLSRHKKRSTWEIPGGHREDGERIEDTATRDLWEETGAVNADIRKVAVYGVEKDGIESYGTLFFADIKRIGNLPDDSEIGEIEMFDTLPKELTYPDIQPYLFNHVQGWLNIQSGAGEMWDVYDENRSLTGRLHRRGDLLKDGEYHLVVHAWLMNSRGEFLLTKRTSNKGFPNMWEMTGGSALAGDDSITAAVREVKEETGLTADPSRAERIFTFKRKDSFVDVWLFRQDFDLDDVILQEGETCDKMYAGKAKLKELHDSGDLVPCPYIDQIMDI